MLESYLAVLRCLAAGSLYILSRRHICRGRVNGNSYVHSDSVSPADADAHKSAESNADPHTDVYTDSNDNSYTYPHSNAHVYPY